jgi:uncharacterized protein (TIGR03437 family)
MTLKRFYGSLIFGFLSAAAMAQQLPSPTLNSLVPNAVVAGSPGFNMRVEGTRFTQSSRVVWRASGITASTLSTTFVNENLLSAVVPAGLLEQPANIPVTVTQPGDNGTTLSSNEVIFTIVAGMTVSTACPLPAGIVGRPYEAQFSPNGGVPPYVFSIAAGSLPTGLAFSQGLVRGTPTAAGDFSFTVRVTDAQNNSASKPCSMRVVAGSEGQTLFVTQLEPAGVLAGSVATQIRVRGDGFSSGSTVVWNSGTGGATDLPTRWDGDPRFLFVTVPQNLLVNPGSFAIAVRAVVLTRPIFSNSENFVVSPPVQVTNACPLRDAPLRAAYSEQLTASGGFPPYTWAVTPGTLPSGIALTPAGLLTGTPVEAGVYDLSLTATDSRGNAATRACSLRVLGPLTAAPGALNFTVDAQGTPPPPQVLSVAGSASGLPFSALVSTGNGGAWLRVTADTSRMPTLVRVAAEPGSLGPGVYRGSVVINTDAATNRTVTVPVTLTVGNVRNSEIVPRPLALRFAAGRGSGRLPWQAIQLSNPGPASVDFSVETTAPWLIATPDRGLVRNNQPVMVRVRASAEGMATGTYRAFVRVSSSGRLPVNVPVTLSVGLSPETLTVAQSGMSFTAVQGGPVPTPRSMHVLSTGSAGYFWEASTSTSASRPFVSVNPPSNASRPGQPSGSDVRVDPEGLASDLHFGDVRVVSSNTDNSPRLISTVLEILPAQATPFPELPFTGLLLTASPGSATTTAQSVLVRNIARSPIVVDYQLVGDARIFTATASAARTLGPGESRRIEVQANVGTTGAGVQRAVLYVQSSGDPQVRAVDVTLVLTPNGQCTPTRLVASPLSHAEGFQVTGGLPAALEFRVVDDCGAAVNSGVFTVAPSNSSGIAYLQPGGDGRWAGTWPVLQNTASAVTLNYYVEDPDRSLQTTGSLAGFIAASNVPVTGEDAIVSAASFARGAPLTPGSLYAVFGVQGAQSQTSAQSLPLPFMLGQTRVQVGERETPLFYAGDLGGYSQVNAMMPYDVATNTLLQIAVWRGARRSPYTDVAIAPAQPAIFVVVGETAAPFERGKVVVIYCEGLGQVNAQLLAGQAAPANPLATVRNPVTVTIGGQNATVQFAGLTPGLTGLYQINAVVPDGAAPGPAVPVVISSAGLSSDPVTIAIR